jgi:predicted 2-oxoglutarate/Fe(II)-dependent dioxygenase YbiX/peroxiredoxin
MKAEKRSHPLVPGDPAPWFTCRTRTRERYAFDTVAGRYVVLSFLGAAGDPQARALLEGVRSIRARFDDEHAAFFGVLTKDADAGHPLLQDAVPGMRFFFDDAREVSGLYGAVVEDGSDRRLTYVLDPSLRVLAALPVNEGHFERLHALLERLPALPAPEIARPQAPVLVLPHVFEPALCRDLIAYYERLGGRESGFMREVDGKTKLQYDHGHKRRRDRDIEDADLRRACMSRIHDRLAPQIEKAFQFRATRMERYIVSCYDADEDGHFRPHRDNTTKGTAHRRFAVSLFLNSGEYEGGFLRFPEFGAALYTAPTGGAVVFGCSMLHEATRVTRGRRYMFLPFLYDDAAARVRKENLKYLELDSAT